VIVGAGGRGGPAGGGGGPGGAGVGARLATRKLSWPSSRDQIRTISAWWALAMIDAALPAADPAEAARAHWVLGDAWGQP